MANGHGGYRRPANPAPVSGPGALSKRTDGRQPTMELPNAKYGEAQAFREAQQAAPVSGGMPDLSGIVPFGAPTQRPEEPLTAGMPFGPGGGPSVPAQPVANEAAAKLRSYLPVLTLLASQDDADPATRQFVRQIRGDL
jgi:hypothetical protein